MEAVSPSNFEYSYAWYLERNSVKACITSSKNIDFFVGETNGNAIPIPKDKVKWEVETSKLNLSTLDLVKKTFSNWLPVLKCLKGGEYELMVSYSQINFKFSHVWEVDRNSIEACFIPPRIFDFCVRKKDGLLTAIPINEEAWQTFHGELDKKTQDVFNTLIGFKYPEKEEYITVSFESNCNTYKDEKTEEIKLAPSREFDFVVRKKHSKIIPIHREQVTWEVDYDDLDLHTEASAFRAFKELIPVVSFSKFHGNKLRITQSHLDQEEYEVVEKLQLADRKVKNKHLSAMISQSLPDGSYTSISVRTVTHQFALEKEKAAARMICLKMNKIQSIKRLISGILAIFDDEAHPEFKPLIRIENSLSAAILGSNEKEDIDNLTKSFKRGDKLSLYVSMDLRMMDLQFSTSLGEKVYSLVKG